ncbi:MAG: M28 family peptidase [Elusimicrobia bacterium]|nr:M28 family peptidase [Elusimicrobiota bacterium]
MTYFQAVILGIVQGLTEFLPVSSSAHLVIIPWIAKWEYQGLAFDVALHWGTMLAVLAYFWRDWLDLFNAAWRQLRTHERASDGAMERRLRPLAVTPSPKLCEAGWSDGARDEEGESVGKREELFKARLFWGIVLATIPAGIAGLLFEEKAENLFRRPDFMAWPLMAFGILLWIADRWGKQSKNFGAFSLYPCLLVGLAQALAIVPGVSRSGATITAALLLGFKRDVSARFSFLLSTPIIVAAGLLQAKDLTSVALAGPFWAGVGVSALAGFAAIRFLLGYLKSKDLGVFAFYRVCLGLLILLLWAGNPSALSKKLAGQAAQARMTKPEIILTPQAARLKSHVDMLAEKIGERNPYYYKALNQARDYIAAQFQSLGFKPEIQEFKSKDMSMIDDGTAFYNIEVRLSPHPALSPALQSSEGGDRARGPGRHKGRGIEKEGRAEVLIIGAHYDSAPGTPGADDNASGTAVLLELARSFKGRQFSKEIRLVAFSTEEPPSFFTSNMGSYHYARRLKEQGAKVFGMISLEMVGYFNLEPGSQLYPPPLSFFYPKTGNFVGLVGNLKSRKFMKDCAKAWRAGSDFPLETAALPFFISAASLSDHYNFQKEGWPGLMLTDTAFYRNPHYHENTDTPDKLDYERMARVLEALTQTVVSLAEK